MDTTTDESVGTTTTLDPEVASSSACTDDLTDILAASFETSTGAPDTLYIRQVYGSLDERTDVMIDVALGVYSQQNQIGTSRAIDEGVAAVVAWCDDNADDFGY